MLKQNENLQKEIAKMEAERALRMKVAIVRFGEDNHSCCMESQSYLSEASE